MECKLFHFELCMAYLQGDQYRFLLARLLSDEVLDQLTKKSAKQVLSKPTTSLPMLYDDIMHRLERLPAHLASYAVATLSWLGFARESFTVNQLSEAIAIRTGSDDVNADSSNFFEEISHACAGLIVIEERVSLIHYSFVEYLRTYLTNFTHLLPEKEEPETFIAKNCLAYLRFRPFSLKAPSELADLDDKLRRYRMLQYAARYWGSHAQSVPFEHILDDVMRFFDLGNNTAAAGLVMSIYERHPGHYEQAYRGMIGLHISAYFGLTKFVEHLVTTRRIDPNTSTVGAWTALHWAARQGWASTASSLLQLGASTRSITKLDGWNALHLAAIEGHLDVVTSLIQVDPYLNAQDFQMRTALYLSTWAGFSNIAKKLLNNGADPSLPNAYGATALHCAAKRGRATIVTYLLDAGANANAEDDVGLTALDEAIRKQNETIVQILVDAGAVQKEKDNPPSTGYKIDVLDWDTYIVNSQETGRIKNGNQCVCHVLERTASEETTTSSLVSIATLLEFTPML